MKVTVLGAGSFGTAMSIHLASLGYEVLMWTIDKEQAESINSRGINTFCFSDIKLDGRIKSTLSLSEALGFSDRAIMAVPTQSVREVLGKIAKEKHVGIHILNLAKGIEISTGKLPNFIYREVCPDLIYSALSGPSHAEEVALGKPAAVSLASEDEDEAISWQDILNGNNFRVYTTCDVVGIEVGGAAKNIYAIAAGVVKAMDLGDNATAALACRGLAEIMRLGHKIGASPLTLSGLAGVGDLMVTCYSAHSRNFRLGLAIGQGKSFEEAIEELGQVAEGAYTVKAVVAHSKEFDVDMPLAQNVYRVLYEGESPHTILKELLARTPKPEIRF